MCQCELQKRKENESFKKKPFLHGSASCTLWVQNTSKTLKNRHKENTLKLSSLLLSLRKRLPRNLQIEYTGSLMCSQLSLPRHFSTLSRTRSAHQGRSLLLYLSWVLHVGIELRCSRKAVVHACHNMRYQSIDSNGLLGMMYNLW